MDFNPSEEQFQRIDTLTRLMANGPLPSMYGRPNALALTASSGVNSPTWVRSKWPCLCVGCLGRFASASRAGGQVTRSLPNRADSVMANSAVALHTNLKTLSRRGCEVNTQEPRKSDASGETHRQKCGFGQQILLPAQEVATSEPWQSSSNLCDALTR